MAQEITDKPLSKTQADLLEYMRAGGEVRFLYGIRTESYFYRRDTEKKCSAAGYALEKRGLLKRPSDWRGGRCTLVEQASNG